MLGCLQVVNKQTHTYIYIEKERANTGEIYLCIYTFMYWLICIGLSIAEYFVNIYIYIYVHIHLYACSFVHIYIYIYEHLYLYIYIGLDHDSHHVEVYLRYLQLELY